MTVAEAVEPLYRAYLRRLEEMAARLPAQALLTEETARANDGSLALSEEMLPLRFDVADARDGHTWEVHGAREDAPLCGEVQVGGVRVVLQPGNWEQLPVVCAFENEPPREDANALADVLRGFAILAWHGAFAGRREGRWKGVLHGMSMVLRGNELWAVYDLGTCPPLALEALCAAIAGYRGERAPLGSVRIGGKPG